MTGHYPPEMEISIHAPLAGRDVRGKESPTFYPVFQSTRPSRGATARTAEIGDQVLISIHAPLAGRD